MQSKQFRDIKYMGVIYKLAPLDFIERSKLDVEQVVSNECDFCVKTGPVFKFYKIKNILSINDVLSMGSYSVTDDTAHSIFRLHLKNKYEFVLGYRIKDLAILTEETVVETIETILYDAKVFYSESIRSLKDKPTELLSSLDKKYETLNIVAEHYFGKQQKNG